MPWISAKTSAQSSTVRPSGPTTSKRRQSGSVPVMSTAPGLGLKPTMPFQAAGRRIEPPVSDPIAAADSPIATATAEPPEEPPATRLAS